MTVYALSRKHEGIANCIITQTDVENIFTNEIVNTLGIWDTGATNSVITKSVAAKLGLKPIEKANARGVHGVKEVNVYYVNITLNNKSITLNAKVTECEELSVDNGIGMLIGMNIITMGDFSITNFKGETRMTFRVPSIECIDYVESIEEYNKYLKMHEVWIKKGMDKCPCGSGKKYKNCHGKISY